MRPRLPTRAALAALLLLGSGSARAQDVAALVQEILGPGVTLQILSGEGDSFGGVIFGGAVGDPVSFEVTTTPVGPNQVLIEGTSSRGGRNAPIECTVDTATAAAFGPGCDLGINTLAGEIVIVTPLIREATQAGQQTQAALVALLSAMRAQSRTISRRLSRVRQGAPRGLDVTGLRIREGASSTSLAEWNNSVNLAYAGHEQIAAEQPGARPSGGDDDAFGRWGIFGSGYVSLGDTDRTSRQAGSAIDTEGLTLGADYLFSDSFLAGVALGYAHTNIDFDGRGGKVGDDLYQATAYASFFRGPWTVDGVLTYGYNDFDRNRRTAGGAAARSDGSGHSFSGRLSAGYELTWADWSLTPGLSLDYTHIRTNDYQERGAGPANLRVDDTTLESLVSGVGITIARPLSRDFGILVPELRLAWKHEFLDGVEDVSSALAVGGPAFTVSGQSPDRDYLTAGAGVSFIFPDGWSGFIDAEADVFNSREDRFLFTVGLRKEL